MGGSLLALQSGLQLVVRIRQWPLPIRVHREHTAATQDAVIRCRGVHQLETQPAYAWNA